MSIARRLGVSVVAFGSVLGSLVLLASGAPAPPGIDEEDGIKPLVDVHHLMEDVVGSAFGAAKKGLSKEPADTATWKNVRSMGLIIGESGNLLLGRAPEEVETKAWTAMAVKLREAGDELYKTAKKKDYAAASKAYINLVDACNKCHVRFNEEGEPKIEP
jgi:hypothetical protein